MGQKFLKFQLQEGKLALFNAAIAPEIRQVEDSEILPVPQMSEWVLGIYQWRDEMLWSVDLGHLLGLSPLSWHNKNFLIVLQLGERSLGAIVPKVNGIEEYDLQHLQAPSDDSCLPGLIPFLEGFFLTSAPEIHYVLRLEAIFFACAQKALCN
jgi:positive phototaxis protein PixI